MNPSLRENKLIRRPLIAIMVVVAIPIFIAVFIAEVVWKTSKAMVGIILNLIKEDTPTINEAVSYVKRIW